MQRTCYYDAVRTGDLSFGVYSRQAAEEQAEFRSSILNPPRFNAKLSLRRIVRAGEQVNISFEAASEYSMAIVYKLIRGPNGSTLDERSGQLQLQVPVETRNGSEIPVQVSATDGTKNLTSSYEVSLIVETVSNEQVQGSPTLGSLLRSRVLSVLDHQKTCTESEFLKKRISIVWLRFHKF